MTNIHSLEFRERFFDKVELLSGFITDEDCWLWTGTTTSGYGIMRIDKCAEYSHRIAFKIFRGPIPLHLRALHKCDTKLCVNPSHLFLGTNQENQQDLINKGLKTRGNIHSQCKITDEQIIEMGEKYKTGRYTQKDLGKIYGIDPSQVSRMLRQERRSPAILNFNAQTRHQNSVLSEH